MQRRYQEWESSAKACCRHWMNPALNRDRVGYTQNGHTSRAVQILWKSHSAKPALASEHGATECNVCPEGFQSYFGPIPPILLFFLYRMGMFTVPIHVELFNLLFGFYRSSNLKSISWILEIFNFDFSALLKIKNFETFRNWLTTFYIIKWTWALGSQKKHGTQKI